MTEIERKKGELCLQFFSQLKEKTGESMAAVLPITVIVFVLSVTLAPLDPGTLILFLFGAVLLVAGMGFLLWGSTWQ